MIKSVKRMMRRLARRVTGFEEDLKVLRQQIAGLQQQISGTQDKIESAKQHRTGLQQQITETQKQITEMQKQITEMQQHTENMEKAGRAALSQLRAEHASRLDAQHKTQEAHYAELSTIRKGLTDRQEALSASNKDFQKRLFFIESFFAPKGNVPESGAPERTEPSLLGQYKGEWFHPDYYHRHEVGEWEDKKRLLDKAIQLLDPDSRVLDVGPGNCFAMDAFMAHGHRAIGIGLDLNSYITEENREKFDLIEGDYLCHEFDAPFDAIWASHVLEHQPNPHGFIQKAHRDLKEGGWFFVLVPPMKAEIVGGHLNLFNNGLLLYQLVVGGFDCSKAMVTKCGYNIVTFVRKKSFELPALRYDSGDLETLAPYFPFPIAQNTNGLNLESNWEW